ncbi:MAG: hypothetical protein ACYSWT_03965 [Planctomycetota bacterium]|jgi:hypothetical protein
MSCPRLTVLVAVLCSLAGPALGADPAGLVQGVGQIVAPGVPGPVHPMSPDWWAVAAGDEDATFPSLYCAAREYGSGRIVILGHGSLLSNTDLLDNGVFALNVMRWLDDAGSGDLRYTTGHAEWITGSALSGLAALVAAEGMTLSALPAPIEAGALAGVSALIVGNAWGDFTADEIEVVRQWVDAGGGLLLVGLGWSWEPYHPGTSIEDYPMMKLAVPYDIRWLRNTISDPTDQFMGSPVFHTFYPDIELATVAEAIATLQALHADHGGSLPEDLESDADVRLSFVRSHQLLAVPATEFPPDHPERSDVDDAYAALTATEPGFYRRDFSFDESIHPTAAWVRERGWRTWADSLELTPARKTQMASLTGLAGLHLDVFSEFALVLLDNARLSDVQLGVVHADLTLIPGLLHRLRAISVKGFLGDPAMPVPLAGLPWMVNIFSFEVGEFTENPFPDDVDPILMDVFCAALAHEINHVVDAYTIGGSSELSSRRDRLIADAGEDPMNYLRSMFPPGTFVNAPQEFFASISNQWFCDSVATIELGRFRFDIGRPDPINQALFFADVYAGGGETTLFYRTDLDGNVERRSASLTRNPSSHIDSINVGDVRYDFDLDPEGRVTAYATAPAADIDRDGVVGVVDFLALLAQWGLCPPWPDACRADLDGDGVVGVTDFLALLAAWS